LSAACGSRAGSAGSGTGDRAGSRRTGSTGARCRSRAAPAPLPGTPVPHRSASAAGPGPAGAGPHDRRSPHTVRSRGCPGLPSQSIMGTLPSSPHRVQGITHLVAAPPCENRRVRAAAGECGRGVTMGNAVVHFEIGGPDDAPLVAFYGHLFGWKLQPFAGGGYMLIDTNGGGGINGGIGKSQTGE